ncbi:hypothetical protein ElyMa_004697000 [Elysia marginata]|uniref:Uncharacterized protein n=1 Tax=Elysia marginata TaxID=1093978 RepID=A0AAV4I6Z6_9GAST|nr:hypothetical protein ElyMa_004697000 [Elysia marginata]
MSLEGVQPGHVGRRTGVGLQHGAKSLLRNMIRHTDTHNRLLEEAEMWQVHKRMRGGAGGSSSEDEDRKEDERGRGPREPKIEHSFLYDDRRAVDSPTRSRYGQKRRAHMDEDGTGTFLQSGPGTRGSHQLDNSSTYWQRQLFKAEENDDDRWGHGGFKELYPQDFASDRSDDEGKRKAAKEVEKSKKEKRRREKDGSAKKKKKKHKDQDKHRKKKKRKRQSLESRKSETDDGYGGSEDKYKKRSKSERSKGKGDKSETSSTKDAAACASLRRKGDDGRKWVSSESDSPPPARSRDEAKRASEKRRRKRKGKEDYCLVKSDSESDTSDSEAEPSHRKKSRRRW